MWKQRAAKAASLRRRGTAFRRSEFSDSDDEDGDDMPNSNSTSATVSRRSKRETKASREGPRSDSNVSSDEEGGDAATAVAESNNDDCKRSRTASRGQPGGDTGDSSPKLYSLKPQILSGLKSMAGDELDERYRVIGSQSSRTVSKEKANVGAADSSLSAVLSGMKKVQRNRGRRNGLEMSFRQADSTKEKSDSENEVDETEGYGLLTKNFTKNLDSSISLDQHLEDFLAASAVARKGNTKEEDKPQKTSPSVELYAVPKHLEVTDSTKELKEKMTWVTGLTEVALPMEVRLKNIEATEKAKRKMLKMTEAEPDIEKQSGDAIRSIAFGTRFFKFEPARLANNSKRPTDDALFGKFRKRQRFAFKR